MSENPSLVQRLYGDRAFHLIILLATFPLAAYAISVLGVENLFSPAVWWQSILVWFLVAIIAHDLILFPLYSLADRLLPRSRHAPADHRGATRRASARIPLTNYLRMPTLAAGLLFLMFFPGIIQQGASSYRTATGMTQDPFLTRWLLIAAAFYLASALCYLVKSTLRHRRSTDTARPPSQLMPTGGDS